jgi:ADP-heptose:LPS heptosyltransferase
LKPLTVFKPWNKKTLPKKILVIRFQALGDTVVTLPYLLSLKKQLPQVALHFLTREEVSLIPSEIDLFEKIIIIKGGRNLKLQFFYCLKKIPAFWIERYDIVIDLQNHILSKCIRISLRSSAWSSFDKYSPLSAGERTKLTINALNLCQVKIETDFVMKSERFIISVEEKLAKYALDKSSKIIIINPAGAFESRHWPLENYVTFCKHWIAYDKKIKFVIVGLSSLKKKSLWLKERLGNMVIDLVNETNAVEAFIIVRMAHLVLTEDSGLMHISWVQGVPTFALFGSTRNDWSAPLGEKSLCLNSSDLPCGNCMQKVCQFGDTHCLTRYTPEYVFQQSQKLVQI